MLRVPDTVEELLLCKSFSEVVGGTICKVPIEPRDYCVLNACHYNCSFNPVLGYYIAIDDHGLLHGFKHSVLNDGERLVDITPTIDDRKYNIFFNPVDMEVKHEHITYTNRILIGEMKNLIKNK